MNARTILHLLILALVLVASAIGVLHRTEGGPIHYTTVRGEDATIQGSGLYRYDPAEVAGEGIVWDTVNLLVAMPLMALATLLAARGSLRGLLLMAGLLFYFFYMYLMYATMVAFNGLFLVYVAIFALSLVAFVLNLGRIDVASLPAHLTERFPRRLLAGYTIAMGSLIFLLWIRLIVAVTVAGRFPAEFAGMNTLQTQALDLGLVVPLMISSGVLLLRRSPWGYLLGGMSVGFGLIMCIVLPAWIIVPLLRQGRGDLVEAIPFLAGCVVGPLLARLYFRSVSQEPILSSPAEEPGSSIRPGTAVMPR